jgi:hypothetical protein
VKPIPLSPFLKGLIASNQVLAQPKGSIARDSNLIYTERGALVTCDGTEILNWFDGAIQGPDAPGGGGGGGGGGEQPVSFYNLGDALGAGVNPSQTLTCVAPNDMPVGDVIIFSVHCFQFPAGGSIPVINGVNDNLGSSNIWSALTLEQTFQNDHSPSTTSKMRIFYTTLTQDIPNGTTFHITATYSVACGTESIDAVGIHNVTVPDQVAQGVFNAPGSPSIALNPTTHDEIVLWFQGLFSVPIDTLPGPGASSFPQFPVTGASMMAVVVFGGGANFVSPPGTYTVSWTIGSTHQNGASVVTFKILGAP